MTSLSLGPHYRDRLGTVLHFAHCVSATYPSAKQVLNASSSEGGSAASDRQEDAGIARENGSVCAEES